MLSISIQCPLLLLLLLQGEQSEVAKVVFVGIKVSFTTDRDSQNRTKCVSFDSSNNKVSIRLN
jgi:hypothetical protein